MRIDDARKPEGWSALPRLARAAVKAGPRDLAAKRTETASCGRLISEWRPHQIGTVAGVKSGSWPDCVAIRGEFAPRRFPCQA